jgi:hypothetical protein
LTGGSFTVTTKELLRGHLLIDIFCLTELENINESKKLSHICYLKHLYKMKFNLVLARTKSSGYKRQKCGFEYKREKGVCCVPLDADSE